MIDELAVENFKRIKSLQVKFPKFTLFVGPNGSGKSSVLQALALLKQSLMDSYLKLSGKEATLGDWKDIVFSGNLQERVRISVAGGALTPRADRFVYTLTFQGGKIMSVRASAQLGGREFDATYDAAGSQASKIQVGRGSHILYQCSPTIGQPFSVAGGSSSGEDKEEYRNLNRELERLFREFNSQLSADISSFFFVGPFRGMILPTYPLLDAPSTEFLSPEVDASPPSRLMSTMGYTRELERATAEMLKELFGTEVELSLVPARQTSLQAVHEGFRINVINEGSGLNQLAFVLAQFAVAPRGATIVIEEPEIHLHPAMQRKLVDLLVRKAAETGKRLIFTTHSEHVLFALVSKVVRGELNPADLGLYQFSATEGGVRADSTTVGRDGSMEPPLRDFFETNLQELMDFLRSASGDSG